MRRKRIVVMGYLAGCPISGVMWQHLHYIAGLQRLGHEAYYVEDTARIPYNPVLGMPDPDPAHAVATLQALGERFGFRDHWAYCPRYLPQRASFGLPLQRVHELYAHADAVFNLCGAHELHEDLLASPRLLLIETDPGAFQVKADQGDPGLLQYLRSHHRLFTFGENIGTPRFPVPLHGVDWLPTRQPVVLEWWDGAAPPPPGAPFTTVTNWSATATVHWRGRPYHWDKSQEFLKCVAAPAATGETFELVSDLPEPEVAGLFRQHGWRLQPTRMLNDDPEAYRRYVQGSRGEFTATKQIVVALQTGWFSDRSACYLAAGRPVVTQDTGFGHLFGSGRGLFGFTGMDDVVEAMRSIRADHGAHCRAAREIAREHFDAGKVLRSVLDRAGL
jgi:hypothetical protein